MTTLTLRNTKGSPLTNTELDANFSNLNTDKAETASPTFTGTISAANVAYTGTLTGSTGIVNIGSGQVYKDASGNVGIGTSSPIAPLYVRRDQAAATYIMADNVGTVGANTSAGFACAEGGSVLGFFRTMRDGSGQVQLYTAGAYPLLFGTNNTERMRLDASGKLNLAALTASSAVFTDASKNLTTTGTLSITQGGTGATTAAAALTALGAYAATNPSAYITASASITGSAARISIPDTRAVDDQPQQKSANSISTDFKNNSAVGSPPVTANGTHSHIITIAGWNTSEGSGGWPSQLSIGDGIAVRQATTATTWGAWRTLLTSNNYNTYAPTLTGTGASGTWAISISGDAATVDGFSASQTNTANNIVVRDANGYITTTWVNMSRGDEATTAASYVYDTGDGYLRKKSLANAKTELVTSAAVTTALGFTPYNSTNPSGYITSSGNAATATTLQTARTINGTSFNGSANIETTEWYHSGRDFINGTLITTSIDYSVANGDPFILEIKGNSYSAAVPFDIQLQGYIYSSSIINISAYSIGPTFNITAMNVAGALCFWFPRISYWQGFNVRAYTAQGTRAINKVVSITDVVNPAGTKQVVFSPVQVLHSSNYNTYAPTLTGTGASGTWAIAITGNAATITSQANSATITASTAATASQIVLRDASGDDYRRYGYSSYLNMSHAVDTARTTDTVFYSSTDDFIRKTNATSFRTSLNVPTRTGTDASGTWAISISGSAATLTTGQTIVLTGDVTYTSGSFNGSASVTGTATLANSGVTAGTYKSVTVDAKGRVTTGTNPTTVSGYGITNALVRGGPIGNIDFNAQRTLASGIYSVDVSPTNGPPTGAAYSNFIQMYERGDTAAQLVIEYSSGRMYSRGIQTAIPTYSAWRTQLDDGNYNSYAPTLTGTGASGTWAIAISGNAATATTATKTPLVEPDASMLFGRSGLQYFNISGAGGDVATTTNAPDANWWHIIRGNHANGAGYYTDLALPMTSADSIKYRRISNGVSYGWTTVLDSTNYTSYITLQEKKRSITASTAATAINLNTGDLATVFKVTISANTTITFSNFPTAAAGETFSFTLMTVNDATAGRALAFGNTIKWSGGVLPPRTTSANAIDIWTFFVENSVYYGSLSMIDIK